LVIGSCCVCAGEFVRAREFANAWRFVLFVS